MHIEFTEGEDKIVLEGPTKDIQIVQSQIEAIVTDLVGTETDVFTKAVSRKSDEVHWCSKVFFFFLFVVAG